MQIELITYQRRNIMNTQIFVSIIIGIIFLLFCSLNAGAQTTEFTYQGKLTDSTVAQPTNGSYEMQFRLYDNPAAGQGNQQGLTLTKPAVQVVGGIFTVGLDFGALNFANGANLFLELSVRPAGNSGGYTSLAPRQQLTSAPYAIKSLSAASAIQADTANNANNLGGIPAAEFVLNVDPRLSNARDPLPGSSNYIQNTASTQAATFSISGDGTSAGTLGGNVVNATTHFAINGIRVLHTDWPVSSTFLGRFAGAVNTGSGNTFTGDLTGRKNTNGNSNSFFGAWAGEENTDGSSNAFFGALAGSENTSGNRNSFYGANSGDANISGSDNAFFGTSTGFRNTSGSFNAFFGRSSGINSRGGGNTFIGYSAGEGNTDGGFNTLVGFNSNVTNDNLHFATAIGAEATVSNSDTVVIGKNGGLYNSIIRPADKVIIAGTLEIGTLGTTGGVPLCRNGGNRISACSAPLVDEDKFKTLSDELKTQRQHIERQQALIDQLRKLVCAANAEAEGCRQ